MQGEAEEELIQVLEELAELEEVEMEDKVHLEVLQLDMEAAEVQDHYLEVRVELEAVVLFI
jgi:hypothetical protein